MRAAHPPRTERYGAADMQVLDIYAPKGATKVPVLVYLHGGAWLRGSRLDVAYPAPSLMGRGAALVVPDFNNVSEVGLPAMIEQCRAAVDWTVRNAASFGGDHDRVYLAGHSSGAHLASCVLLGDSRVKGALVISGMYDLHAPMLSARSSYVKITPEELDAASAMRHLGRIRCPVSVAWSVGDSPEFRRQGRVFAAALEGMFGLIEYFVNDLPRRTPGDGSGIISDLLGLEVEGRSLTNEELLGFCILFVIAGHETTTKMVANTVELLSRHPEQRARLLADPGLVPGAVEEVLRFHNSTQYMHRTLTHDIERHGRTMHAGDSVLLLIGAANHDEREFGPTAETFDILRRPERHLAFGYGAHFCLGAALARMEGKVALEQILARLPDFAVDHDAKVRFHSSNVTGWISLPLTFTPRSPQ